MRQEPPRGRSRRAVRAHLSQPRAVLDRDWSAATSAGTSSSRTTGTASTRSAIPRSTLFDRFVHLAELTTLAGAVFVLVLFGTGVLHPRRARAAARRARPAPRDPRQLLSQAVPRLRARLDHPGADAGTCHPRLLRRAAPRRRRGGSRARSASVAQRVIEEVRRCRSGGEDAFRRTSDDVLIWISQVIDQDVNIFAGTGSAGDERTRSVRVRACCRRARRRTSIARSRWSGCRASSAEDRIAHAAVHDGRRTGARRRRVTRS